MTITLSVDPPVFYSNYQLFLNQLATAIGSSNFNVVNMMAIRQGSTIVDATLNTQAPTGSLEATNQFDSLTNSLSVGTSIGGMQVQQVQANVVGGSIAQVSSGPNLGLILGISIPLAVICKGLFIRSDWSDCVLRLQTEVSAVLGLVGHKQADQIGVLADQYGWHCWHLIDLLILGTKNMDNIYVDQYILIIYVWKITSLNLNSIVHSPPAYPYRHY